MTRIVTPARPRLVYVESRGWLLAKLGIAVLVIAAAILVWGPLVAGRPQAMRLVGWLAWAAVALVALGAVVRVAEAVWGTGCTVYALIRSLVTAAVSTASGILRGARSLARVSRRLVAVLAIALLLAPSGAWAYAMIVLDLTNLIQNTISALKAIESVINEVQMIANQVKQIENMVQNTSTYSGVWDQEALPRLNRLGQIIEQEQAIGYGMAGMERGFWERYPRYPPGTDWAAAYDQWTRTTPRPPPGSPAPGGPPPPDL